MLLVVEIAVEDLDQALVLTFLQALTQHRPRFQNALGELLAAAGANDALQAEGEQIRLQVDHPQGFAAPALSDPPVR